MNKKGYTISYKDDCNKNHILFTNDIRNIDIYYNRFGKENVSFKETRVGNSKVISFVG